MLFNNLDIFIVVIYCVGIVTIAQYVSKSKQGQEKTAEDYFLAGRSLPWWAIGASLIAANISAEQIIGMSGQGFVVGMAIATYELTAAIALIVMAKFFLPLFLEKQIYTMPQFLEHRFDNRVSLVLSFFWLAVYVFINLTSVLWLGSLAINSLTGLDLFYGLVLLATLSLAYSLWGGLKAVAMTDIIQVILLIFGGLSVSYIALNQISDDAGVLIGLSQVYQSLPEKFDMILSFDHPAYKDLPGVWVLIGGLWIAHFAYWGFNQYITQRALGAKSLPEAQKGVMFAAYLKLLMPFVVVLPGICAAIIYPGLEKSDQAYPMMMALLPNGLLGLTFAALVAAIVSSLASMTNSISTIFTMDIYRSFTKSNPSQQRLVSVGRNIAWIALVIAVICAQPLLGSMESAFQYIQNFTGFFTPGILVIFLVALFWKKATTLSVLVAAIMSLILSLVIFLVFPEYPFIHRMGIVFLVSGFGCYITALLQGYSNQPKAIDLVDINFKTEFSFNINTIIICMILFITYFFTVVMNSQDSFSDKKVLLIDIGGTNIRTATAEIGSNEINNASKQNLDCLDSFDQIIQNLLSKDQNIKHIVFSVAGPKLHQSITMTNRNFEINEKTILKKFSLDSCHILNDWESIGHGLSLFDTKAMSFINKCDGFNQTSLVIGPGTGLGAAQVIKDNIVLPTEIGNSSLTLPKLFEDFEPIAIENFNIIESIISGGGLKQIYKIFSNEEKSSEEIVSSFSNDEFSQKAINFFLNSFSQILSELALAYMPGNGVFIAGGLMRSMHQFIDNSIFMKNFLMNRKSMHAKILSQMPIAIINQEMTCLHGSLNFINKISEKHK